MNNLIITDNIESKIYIIRGQRVMIDIDLANLYSVTKKRLREQIRRNIDRFPPDFMFELSPQEKNEVAAKCGNLKNIKYSKHLPKVFTEHGTLMLANVLKSESAANVSIQVVRAFVKLREMALDHGDLAIKIEQLEKKCEMRFRKIFEAIYKLMEVKETKTERKIGFLRN